MNERFPKVEFPSDKIRPPFSTIEPGNEYTLVENEVYCRRCRYRTVTKLVAPKCGDCRSYLIMVPKDESRMT